MTPWCVVDEQTSEKQRTPAWGRLVLVSVVALLVAGTGVVLIPRDSGTPPAIPFSESARARAFEDTLQLSESAAALAEASVPDTGKAGLEKAVTLLTTHARALLDPADTSPSTSSRSSTPLEPPTDGTPNAKPTRAALVTALAGSGQKRLDDAREADGGIARLLAAVGSAQLLEAEELAAAWQLPAPKQTPYSTSKGPSGSSVPAAGTSATACPSTTPIPDAAAATTGTALAASVRAQQEAVYVYQVALRRLDNTATAARYLQVHEQMLQQAEALTRASCTEVPASEAGYRLPGKFAQDPASFLGALESSSLPGFGDLVALATGDTRDWAIDGLLAAARRSTAWGADVPALPGIELDAGNLPPLPTPGSTPGTATGSKPGSR